MKESIEEILESYKELVRDMAGRFFALGSEKEDLVQEGMIGLVRAYNSYDESRGASFGAYAAVCIKRQLINAVKKDLAEKNAPLNTAISLDSPIEDSADSQVFADILPADPGESPEERLLYKELLELVLNPASGCFSSLEHTVIELLIEGRSYTEIAELSGKTPKQIDNAIQRIKKKINIIIK